MSYQIQFNSAKVSLARISGSVPDVIVFAAKRYSRPIFVPS